ncbi:hypothetical protein evm_002773 [Chilo suppressalis]|nr:hypothetical protein evm_002773 [Chilo suppressalis]
MKIYLSVLWGIVAGFGVTGGAHRLWSHRAYKAKWPLKVILAICYAAAGQNNIYNWVRDHRVHHKYSETTADPHDANRGFFFSHVGWLMMKKHPEVLKKGAKIDMSDITRDPLIQFHNRYFTVLKLVFCFALPTVVPVCFLGAGWYFTVMSQCVRYMVTLNATWSVNSFAHLWGSKPYDRTIMPSENWGVSFMALGEGWHNYHHTFPWDYKAAELPYATNLTTVLLDMFAAIGWAYDMKVTPKALIKAVIENKGDKRQHP